MLKKIYEEANLKTIPFLLVNVLFSPKEKVRWWAGPDLNRRPSARQADVLTRLDDRPYSHFRMFFSYLSFSFFWCQKRNN